MAVRISLCMLVYPSMCRTLHVCVYVYAYQSICKFSVSMYFRISVLMSVRVTVLISVVMYVFMSVPTSI